MFILEVCGFSHLRIQRPCVTQGLRLKSSCSPSIINVNFLSCFQTRFAENSKSLCCSIVTLQCKYTAHTVGDVQEK